MTPIAPIPKLFLDRDIWSRRLSEALQQAGVPFESHRDRFASNTPDEQWLADVGSKGLIVLTRDSHIRYRRNELDAVIVHNVHLFVLVSGNLSAALTAEVVLKAWPNIRAAVAATAPPAIWRVQRSGAVVPQKF